MSASGPWEADASVPAGESARRDWFAGMAMQGILINQEDDAISAIGHAEAATEYAEAAYRIADAMLKVCRS